MIAIIAGSIFALAQSHLKKMLCYLIVAEVGYMVGGAWLADSERWGLTGSMYHILADALMTLCLFLAVGILGRNAGVKRLADLDGIFKKMPLTMVGFLRRSSRHDRVSRPPADSSANSTSFGEALNPDTGNTWVALLISSLVNAVLFFRIFEIAYFGKNPAEGHHHHDEDTQQGTVNDSTGYSPEARLTTLIPLWITAVLIVALGLMNGPVVEFIRQTAGLIPEVTANIN